jgi:3-hydroxyacyl-CoA dehydrogenase
MSVGFEVVRDVAVLTLKNPPVNGLSKALRSGIMTALDKSHGINGVKAVVMMGGGGNFCAGADIKEFASGTHLASPTLGEVFQQMEKSSLPIVAALHGPTLGGGLETALACHWRIAEDKTTQMGLPEVHLGILPGAGGTQRLPRLTGAEVALDLMTSGRFVNAAQGLKYGIVDNVFSNIIVNEEIKQFLSQAAAAASSSGGGGAQYQHSIPDMYLKSLSYVHDHVIPFHANNKRGGVSQKLIRNLPPARVEPGSDIFDKARKFWSMKQPNLRAPSRIISCVEFATTSPDGDDLDKGLEYERMKFQELSSHPQSAALQYAFFGDRGSFKSSYSPKTGDESNKPIAVKSVAVIGKNKINSHIHLYI